LDFDTCSATLRSGEVHTGDVIVGADGAFGLVRKRLVSEQHAAGEDALIGLAVYRYVSIDYSCFALDIQFANSTTIPKSVAMADKVTSMLYNDPQVRVSCILILHAFTMHVV
jgi:hypothetical protein